VPLENKGNHEHADKPLVRVKVPSGFKLVGYFLHSKRSKADEDAQDDHVEYENLSPWIEVLLCDMSHLDVDCIMSINQAE
jgi:hypothetical protein